MNSPVRLGDSPATSIPTGFFSQRFGDFISPAMEPWVERSVLLPSYSSHFICTQMWDHLLHRWCWPTQSSSHHLSTSPLLPGCTFLPFLLFWMKFSSFSPWLSNFQTIRYSGSSGYFLFLNLLFFFWLCEEVKCIPTLPPWPEVCNNRYFKVHEW